MSLTKYAVTKLKLAAFLKSDSVKAISLALAWQLTMTTLGALFDASLSHIFQAPARPDGPFSLLRHTFNWDSNWYTLVIHDAYKTSLPSSVFYPLFPLSVDLVHFVSFGLLSTLQAALLINTISLAFIIYALIKIAAFFIPQSYRWWVVAVFITSPAAIFLHLFYTEALFCALAFWAYLFALRRHWWKMGIALGLLTAVRLPAVLFILLCGLEFLRAYEWKVAQIVNWQLLSFLLAPVGFIAYGIYLYIIRHDFLAMFHGYSHTHDWSYQVFNLNIFHTYNVAIRAMYQATSGPVTFDEGLIVNNLLPIVAIGALLLGAIYSAVKLRKQGGLPLALFALASIILFSVNSNVVSVHRYALPCIVIYLAFVHFVTAAPWRRYIMYGTVYIGVILQTFLYILFINSYFAG